MHRDFSKEGILQISVRKDVPYSPFPILCHHKYGYNQTLVHTSCKQCLSPVGLLGFRAHALPATLCTQVTSVCTTASGVNAPCHTITRVGWRTVMKTVFLEVGMREKTVGGHVLQAKNLTQGEP